RTQAGSLRHGENASWKLTPRRERKLEAYATGKPDSYFSNDAYSMRHSVTQFSGHSVTGLPFVS
ncbi:MAG: hypothetical protein MUF23_18755, partial [Pirellula sp.]|nr:hypothetical protein [Pirellula sp.]